MHKTFFRPTRNVTKKQPKPHFGKVDAPHFTASELEPILIDVLQGFSGSASKRTIEAEIERRLLNEFNPADLEKVGEGISRWKKNVQWIRFDLVERCIMKKDSQRGVWELSELSSLKTA